MEDEPEQAYIPLDNQIKNNLTINRPSEKKKNFD